MFASDISTFSIFDEFVKSQKPGFSVIPAKAGIQFFPMVINDLDSGFHRSDDFLRIHQFSCIEEEFRPRLGHR